MPVVSNTSPILALAAIHYLHLLRQQFDSLEIPPTVFAELKAETDFRGASEVAQALQDGWIIRVEIQDQGYLI